MPVAESARRNSNGLMKTSGSMTGRIFQVPSGLCVDLDRAKPSLRLETGKPGEIGLDLFTFRRVDRVNQGHGVVPNPHSKIEAQASADPGDLLEATFAPLHLGDELLRDAHTVSEVSLAFAACAPCFSYRCDNGVLHTTGEVYNL